MSYQLIRVLRVVACMLPLVVAAANLPAQTHFQKTVTGVPVPVDFHTLASFQTPEGTGTGRQTVVKFVVDTADTSTLLFRVEPQTVGVDGNRSPVDLTVGGASAFIEESGVAVVVADNVEIDTTGESVATNHSMLQLTIDYDDGFNFPSAETWHLKAFEQDIAVVPKTDYFGFAGSNTIEVTEEKMEAVSSINFGAVQMDVSSDVAPVSPVTIQNVGTAPMQVSASLSNLLAADEFSLPVSSVTPNLLPGEELENIFDEDASDGVTQKVGLWVMARPQELSDRTANLNLSSVNDSAVVPLQAKGVNLYAHLLMDCSPSMDRKLDSQTTGIEEETRLYKAKEAAKELNNWVNTFSSKEGYLGLVTFPQCDGAGTSEVRVNIDRSINTHAIIQSQMAKKGSGGLGVGDGTPIEAGISAARSDMNTRINDSNMEPQPADRPNLEQAMILLTDGEETSGSAANQIGPLASDGISMFTVGYGTAGEGGWGFDHTLLGSLASQTGGEFWDASALTPFALKDAFKAAMTPLLGLRVVEDPKGTIRRSQTKSHPVCVEADAFGLTFSVDWDTAIPNALEVTLRNPTGQLITPTSANITYFESETFVQYIIQGARVRGGQAAGEWTVQITGSNAISATQDTQYSYNALVQSPVIAQPKFPELMFGLDQLFVVEILGWNPDPEEEVEATLRYDIPGESRGTFLATHDIDPAWVFGEKEIHQRSSTGFTGVANAQTSRSDMAGESRVPHQLVGEQATITQRKLYALANIAGTRFENKRVAGDIVLRDDGTAGDEVAGDGRFSAYLPELTYDGMHSYVVDFAAFARTRKQCVNREIRFDRVLDVAFAAGLVPDSVTWASVSPDLFFDPSVWHQINSELPRNGFERSAVVFEGVAGSNHLGPGRASDVTFEVEGGVKIGGTIDNWDGTYIQVIEYQKGAQPSVVVQAAGVTSSPIEMPEWPPRWLKWLILIIILVIVVVIYIVKRS